MSRTITEGSVNLDKFPTSRVHQLAKKFKSSKATMQHIKQVASDPQATQINLMQHEGLNFPQIDTTRRDDHPVGHNSTRLQRMQQPMRSRNPMRKRSHIELLTNATNVMTPYVCKDSNALLRNTNVRYAINMVNSPVYVTKTNLKCIIRIFAETLECTNYMQVPCMHKTVPVTVIPKNPALMNHFAYSYKHKAIRLKVSRFHKLII